MCEDVRENTVQYMLGEQNAWIYQCKCIAIYIIITTKRKAVQRHENKNKLYDYS